MRDYTFYTANYAKTGFLGKLLVPLRRILSRILRPLFQRQVELFEGLDRDVQRQGELLEGLDRDMQRLEGIIVDREAVARRLALLEDRLETLLQQREGMRKAS